MLLDIFVKTMIFVLSLFLGFFDEQNVFNMETF